MNRDHIINAALLAIASLGLVNPEPAKSELLGNIVGARYCKLRSYGVSHQESLQQAIRRGLVGSSLNYVTIGGQRVSVGAMDAANWIVEMCPQYLPPKYSNSI